MKQPHDKHEDIDVCEQADPVTTVVRRTAAEPTLPHQELWDFWQEANDSPTLAGHRAAVFAHEAANSLTAISCSIQFVQMELQANRIKDPVLNRVVQSALAEIDGVGALLHEYCTLTQFPGFKFEIADLGELVEDVLALQSLTCRTAGIIVKFECETGLPWVRMERHKIRQVITNLFKNAREAMPTGGQLTIKVYRSGHRVVLELTDSGVGVPDGVDIFELFKTTKPGGQGVGLPLARAIISAHRGAIAFISEADRGTTFRMSLPWQEQPLEADRRNNVNS